MLLAKHWVQLSIEEGYELVIKFAVSVPGKLINTGMLYFQYPRISVIRGE